MRICSILFPVITAGSAIALAASAGSTTRVMMIVRIDACPRAAFAALLDLAARDPDRSRAIVERYLQLVPTRPADALAAAGHNLHEYCRLLDLR